MSIKHVKGDILATPTRNEDTVICHQVNCCGVMGAGLAKQIRDKWPVVTASKMAKRIVLYYKQDVVVVCYCRSSLYDCERLKGLPFCEKKKKEAVCVTA